MALKSLFLLATLLAVHLKADALLPSIHITNAVKGKNGFPPINIVVRVNGSIKGSAQLKPSQRYDIKVDVNSEYYASAVSGSRFTSFHAYEPARDIGRAAIYWKADNDGFALSYDGINWKKTNPWESE